MPTVTHWNPCVKLEHLLWLLVSLAWVFASTALAATTTIPGTPISITLYDTNGGRHQVAYNGVNQVYGGSNAASGITINLNGTRYGFSAGATGGIVGSQLLGLASQTALLGTGSSLDPWRVETTFTASSTTIKQTVTYVNGQNALLFRWDITSTVNVAGVNFFHGVDTFTFNDDNSFAGFSSACNSSYSYNTVGGVSLYQEFVGITPPSAYQGALYSTIWNQMRSGTLNNTSNTTVVDNGLALQWDFALTANQTKTIQQKWAFGATPCSTTPLPSLSGRVYLDANHNAMLEPNEGSTGVTGLIAKLIPQGASSVLETTTVAADGTYQFPAVPPGSFTVILDDNATSTDITPYRPPGFVGTEAPTQSRTVTAGTSNITGQHFGLYAGSTVSGRVFRDNGQGAGTANDAVQNGLELGMSGIRVSVSAGSSVLDSSLTDGMGSFTLWVPTGSPSTVDVSVQPNSNRATGNNIAGVNVMLASSLSDPNASKRTLTFSSGQAFMGYNFGLVPAVSFAPDQSGNGSSPGSVAFTHLYRPGTLGAANIVISSPNGMGTLVYLDANCDGTITPAEHATPVTAFTITAAWPREADGQFKACAFEVVISLPSGLTDASTHAVHVTVTQTWMGSSLNETKTVTDTVRVGSGNLKLNKQVRNITQNTSMSTSVTGKPGEVLEYCIELRNQGTASLGNVVLRDPIPFFTVLVNASLKLNALLLTDATDADAGEISQGIIVVRVGTITPGGMHEVCYRVQIK